jgi:hypothetical protein
MNSKKDEKLVIEDNTVYEIDDDCVRTLLTSQQLCKGKSNGMVKKLILALLFKEFYK